MNIHLQVSQREYNALLRQAGRDAKEVRHARSGQVLFATIPVTLYVDIDRGRGSRRYARSYDDTYSKTILDITQEG